MAYVSPQGPLPRNSYDPVTACEAARAQAIVQSVEDAATRGKWASAQIAGPSSFRQFGAGVVIDVARSQNGMVAASGTSAPPKQSSSVAAIQRAAPRVLPLNVSTEEYAGCSVRGIEVRPVPVPAPALTMPPSMPPSVQVSQTATAPKYKNLCWALRNGAVDQSQFDPSEFAALQLKCSQLGYAGACIPPPLVALYLDQQRRAGTLPHISVPLGVLDSIEQAPDLGGVPCPQSWQMGGLSGYKGRRGMGAAWGDAGSLPCDWNTGAPSARSGVSWLPVGLLALAVVGLAWGTNGRG